MRARAVVLAIAIALVPLGAQSADLGGQREPGAPARWPAAAAPAGDPSHAPEPPAARPAFRAPAPAPATALTPSARA